MTKTLSQIEFYFPQGEFEDRNQLANSTISLMKRSGSIEYCGYPNTDLLREGLLNHFGGGDIKRYRSISEERRAEIERVISETVSRCNEKLTVPTKNFIFVHPYFPTKEDEVFEGVMAVAVYSCVLHLFIDLEQSTNKSIENTVAHELNHTIFYYYHFDNLNNYTLLEETLLEGLAENFREQNFDPHITKWAGALSEEEAMEILKNSSLILESKDKKIIKDFLFGSETYQRWTGYSVGYWLVKKFLEKNPNLSWNEIMKMDSGRFLEGVQM